MTLHVVSGKQILRWQSVEQQVKLVFWMRRCHALNRLQCEPTDAVQLVWNHQTGIDRHHCHGAKLRPAQVQKLKQYRYGLPVLDVGPIVRCILRLGTEPQHDFAHHGYDLIQQQRPRHHLAAQGMGPVQWSRHFGSGDERE